MTRDEVIRIQRALNTLAYPVAIDGIMGPQTHRALMDFQRGKGLAPTGDTDPVTLGALFRSVPAEMPPAEPAPSSDALQLAGERAMDYLEALWRRDVYDPRRGDASENAERCRAIIAGIVARVGWGWALKDGVYVGPEPQWCGLTQADAWREAGIDPQWLATFWASTLRMAKWFRYEDWNGKSAGVRPAIGARMIVPGGAGGFPDGSPFRRGDVVIVGDGNPAEGDHITGLLERTGDDFATLSGNGGGVGPTGKPREGISKQTYHVNRGGYRVLWVARPGVGDLLAPR
jgi:hypothetical protein